MKRVFWQVLFLGLFALRLPAQTALEFFTNQANAFLQPAYGYGVANIPVYSSTNPAIAYSASLHYLLQSAANAYDATTPATNFPSVFRPLFAWSSNTLYIVGYTNVTTDFYTQISSGFKALTDPTIGSNDNVWGIPWVVGMKNNPPAFNEYCYSTAVLAERKLMFVRATSGDVPLTNHPPVSTNQFLCLSISNLFGVEAWNFSGSNFSNGVSIVASNQVTITMTNSYNFGTNYTFNASTNINVDTWPSGYRGTSGASFLVPILANVVSLPESYWSEFTMGFVFLTNSDSLSNSFLVGDLRQKGWPEHNWVLNITNNVMYGLVDNASGQLLDFVNLASFGSSLPIMQVLTNLSGSLDATNDNLAWDVGDASDLPSSPMSSGILFQIATGEATNLSFANALNGVQPSTPGPVFGAPYNPIDLIVQNCTWPSVHPLVHYTIQDLTVPDNEQIIIFPVELPIVLPAPGSEISNSICTLGRRNDAYNSGAVGNPALALTAGMPQLNFTGVADLPYAIWASMDLLDWSQIGIASQPNTGTFQFNDSAATIFPARFYEVRLP